MDTSINIISLISEASLVVKLVMGVLVLLSIVGWLLIFRLMSRFNTANKMDDDFEQAFWSGANLKVLFQRAQGLEKQEHLEAVFYEGFAEFLKLNKKSLPVSSMVEGTQRQMRVSMMRQQSALEQGLSVLASIGSVSPYIGLFGTVWGIMNSFLGLAQTQQANLATVAPGIAEALIATAMGLFAAIPAVLAFNHFTGKSEATYQRRALFAEEMTSLLQREIAKPNTNNPL